MKAAAWLCRGLCLLLVAMGSFANAHVYVSQNNPPAILVFAPDTIGDAAPVRVIAGGNTGLNNPNGLAIDDVHGELYVSDCSASSISVFPLSADGNIAPLRTLTFADAGFHCVRRVVVDTLHDEIIVPVFEGFSSPIYAFPRTATGAVGPGAVAPLRILSGSSTLINNPNDIVFDPLLDEITTNSYSAGGGGVPGLLTFARTASGDVPPSRVLAGPSTLLAGYTNQLAFDSVSHEIYADANGSGLGLAAYSSMSSGDVAPLRDIVGINTGLHAIRGLAFDGANQRVIAIDGDDLYHDPYEAQTLRVFRRTDTADIPPVVAVAGPHTLLADPIAIVVDAAGGFSGIGPQVFATQASFNAAVSGSNALAAETFNGGATAAGQVRICSEPVSAASNDNCFATGQLIDGFSVLSSSGNGVSVVGSGTYGNSSAVIGAVFSGEATIVRFSRGVTAVALDVYVHGNGSSTAGLYITGFDASNRPLSFTRTVPNGNAPAFFGVTSATALDRIELRPANAAGVVLLDNLRFQVGDEIFIDGFES